MKTTVEISEPVLRAANETARREGTTLRALLEEGLQLSLKRRAREQGEKTFRLRDASVGGRGLHPHLRGASWERILKLAHEDHGV